MKVRYLDMIRRYWNEHSDEYCNEHPEHLNRSMHPSWGLAHIPEKELRLLPSAAEGASLVDLGCGRGHDSVGYADLGYNVTGIDISEEQISRAIRHARVRYIVGNAERLSFSDSSVDIAVSDHGAFDYSPTDRLLDELRRVLKPGGMLIICTYHPLALSCFRGESGRISSCLSNSYPVGEIRSDGSTVMPHMGHSAWVRMLRASGFGLERVEEPLSHAGQGMYFDQLVDPEWAARWPVDLILVVSKDVCP